MRNFINIVGLLLEYDQGKTLTNFEKKLADRIKTDASAPRLNVTSAEQALAFLERCDPTAKKAFVLNLVRWYCDRSMNMLEDAPKASEALALYAKFKNKVKRDLGQMSFSEFLDLGDTLRGEKSQSEQSSSETQAWFDNNEATLFHDGDGIKVVIPHTVEASKFFGRGTRWCTAAENNNMFNSYRSGPLYIIIFRGSADRWQFYMTESDVQMMDADDKALSFDVVRDCAPVQKVFRDIFMKNVDVWEYIYKPSLDYMNNVLASKVGNVVIKRLPFTPETLEQVIDNGSLVDLKIAAMYHDFTPEQIKNVIEQTRVGIAIWKGRQTEEMIDMFRQGHNATSILVYVENGYIDEKFLTGEDVLQYFTQADVTASKLQAYVVLMNTEQLNSLFEVKPECFPYLPTFEPYSVQQLKKWYLGLPVNAGGGEAQMGYRQYFTHGGIRLQILVSTAPMEFLEYVAEAEPYIMNNAALSQHNSDPNWANKRARLDAIAKKSLETKAYLTK